MSAATSSSRLAGAADGVDPAAPSPFPWEVPRPPYERVRQVLLRALQDMASGKGEARHVSGGEPFEAQDMLQAARVHGFGFPAGQVEKKAREASRMVRRGEVHAAQREMLGVVAYAVGAWLLLAEQGGEDV